MSLSYSAKPPKGLDARDADSVGLADVRGNVAGTVEEDPLAKEAVGETGVFDSLGGAVVGDEGLDCGGVCHTEIIRGPDPTRKMLAQKSPAEAGPVSARLDLAYPLLVFPVAETFDVATAVLTLVSLGEPQ